MLIADSFLGALAGLFALALAASRRRRKTVKAVASIVATPAVNCGNYHGAALFGKCALTRQNRKCLA
jgi:MYXO-CTERM domain-containing protein